MADFDAPSPTRDLSFLDGGGEASRLILARDWSDHPLGPPQDWPCELRTALSLVLNSPESMILAWGPELTFFYNVAYAPLLGPRGAWAMGARFDRVWSDAWDQARPIIEAAFAGASARFVDMPWTLENDRGATETWWTFSYSRVLDGEGRPAGLFILTNETTERVLTDAALVRSQSALGALNADLERRVVERTAERDRLWDSSPDLLAVIDADGRYAHANPAWTTILGWDADEVIGLYAIDLGEPGDAPAAEHALATARCRELPAFEMRMRHKDGGYRWISWVAAPAGDAVIATGRNITAQKEAEAALRVAEEQLRHAQKVEAVGQLTGGVAHDFNNLLTVIRGSVDLLRRPDLSEARRARYIDAIADTADRATRLTSQLLAFARRQALRPEVFDAGNSVAALRGMIGTLCGPRIALTLADATARCHVDADRSQFDTAIVNMAINARDAMAGEGTLSIRVAGADGLPADATHPAVAGRFVGIALADTGTGIAPADAERIFEPFFTTKPLGEGTGLGLSQVFGFAKQSGGEVRVASVPGEGATFTLYLPRVDALPLPADDAGAGEAGLRPGSCILVVEDDPAVGTFALAALSEIGHETVLATSGEAALDRLEEDGACFDMVFSDVMMPGMSGVDLARTIRRRYPALPVILTSGYSAVLAKGGADGFPLLHKPYSIDELAQALRRAADGR